MKKKLVQYCYHLQSKELFRNVNFKNKFKYMNNDINVKKKMYNINLRAKSNSDIYRILLSSPWFIAFDITAL